MRWMLIVALLPVSVLGLQAQQDRDALRGMFALRGIRLTEDQKRKLKELEKKLTPELRAIQQKRNRLYTAEQRVARRKAMAEARDAGKRGQELRQAAEKAVKLTPEQLAKEREILNERTELMARIQKEIGALLTDRQNLQLKRRADQQGQRRGPAPTHADVKYGTHARNIMDLWLAKSDNPTPVLVSIHGGGFRAGNKGIDGALLNACLKAKISVVAITYRLSQHQIAPAQHMDAARAIQFIRHHAKKWNLDPKRIAATGGSAGAGLSLWLGFHPDLADPDNADPVLRESSRLSCMCVYNGQTSYDPRFIRKLFPGTDTYQHPALAQLFDVDLNKLDEVPVGKTKLFEQVSALPHLTKDDAPAMLLYRSAMDAKITSQGIGIHHPRFGKVLKEQMGRLKIECRVETNIQRGGPQWTELTMSFLKKHLGIKSEE